MTNEADQHKGDFKFSQADSGNDGNGTTYVRYNTIPHNITRNPMIYPKVFIAMQ